MELNKLSRRQLLERGAVAGGVVIGGALFGAFGGVSAATAATGTSPKKGGTLRIGVSGSGTSGLFDAHLSTASRAVAARNANLYEPLFSFTPAYELVGLLAEDVTANSTATEWTVRVRDGVQFHNGKRLTADDVIYSLRRLNDSSQAGALAALDTKNITRLDDRTVRIPTYYPFAPVREILADQRSYIVPVGYDPNQPVGTGPFKFRGVQSGGWAIFDASTNYWGSGPYLSRLAFFEIQNDAARVNALLRGSVDVIDSVPAAQSSAVGSGANAVLVSGGGRFRTLSSGAPLDDPRLRAAMQRIVGLPELVDPELDALYNEALGEADAVRRRIAVDALQRVMDDRGASAVSPTVDGYSTKVLGLVPYDSGISLGAWQFKNVWFA